MRTVSVRGPENERNGYQTVVSSLVYLDCAGGRRRNGYLKSTNANYGSEQTA